MPRVAEIALWLVLIPSALRRLALSSQGRLRAAQKIRSASILCMTSSTAFTQ
ncbi:hypothetical protein AVDCRST_MAG94-6343 [uncultured Leptolyngbya sp.]|uniref:Uncharacterized protein n=1 Tax=uncultured Leptolyngbya sp. TaxID=332963 RepID=A0A6J4P954_9CYAN|nr:hypothetical protein AVDCRST_MAG94-6343 [uncultured Leptolyngbya sp.]